MSLTQILIEAYRALAAKRLRTGLTMLGIIIGIASVVIMLSVGNTVRGFIDKQLALLGSNLLVVQPGAPRDNPGKRGQNNDNAILTLDDATEINTLPSVNGAAAVLQKNFQLNFSGESGNNLVIGTTAEMIRIRNWKLDKGIAISSEDVRAANRVIVIGSKIADQYFYKQDPIGQLIRLDGVPFSVIGVLSGTGRMFDGVDLGDMLITPITAIPIQMPLPGAVHSVIVQSRSGKSLQQTSKEITALLRDRHRLDDEKINDFNIVDLASIAQAGDKIGIALSLAFGFIGAISLLVGGIGIMNIMLVSVSERVREIGIRMAIGAKPSHILIQFLSESIMMCVIGGMIGVGVAALIAWGINQTGEVTMTLAPGNIFIAVFFSTLVGIFFGFYPARRASQMLPIECLRQD